MDHYIVEYDAFKLTFKKYQLIKIASGVQQLLGCLATLIVKKEFILHRIYYFALNVCLK